jgi:hypothetical protein
LFLKNYGSNFFFIFLKNAMKIFFATIIKIIFFDFLRSWYKSITMIGVL